MAENDKKHFSLPASICVLTGAFKHVLTQGVSNLGIPSTRVELVLGMERGGRPSNCVLETLAFSL